MKFVINTDKVKKSISAKLYSDLHYIPDNDLSYVKNAINQIEQHQPNYIFFLGDLIDDSKYTVSQLQNLLNVIYRMTKLSKVILVLGNHDQLSKDTRGIWIERYNSQLVSTLKDIGVVVLQNEVYQDENLYINGRKFTGMYYEQDEPLNQFLDNMSLAQFENSQKFNILLEHSPKHTFDGEVVTKLDNLKNVNLILAGHYHNGCIPCYASELLPGNGGIISPVRKLFPKNARGKKQITENTYGIISSPITTFPQGSKVLKKVFPPTDQTILIKKI